MRLALGGLLAGAISVAFPEVWGNGYSTVTSLLHHPVSWQALALILSAKIIATMASSGSGAVGGIFTPTIFVGAAVGCLYGLVVAHTSLASHIHASAYAIAGMGAVLAAATRGPLMAIVMLFEMTESYQYVLPVVVAAVIATSVAAGINGPVMYGVTLRRIGKEKIQQSLSTGTVFDITEPVTTTVSSAVSLRYALEIFEQQPVKYIYTVSERGEFLGVVARRAVAAALANGAHASSSVASIVSNEVVTLTSNDTYATALEAFLRFPGERLPVVDAEPVMRLRGIVRKSNLLRAYADVATEG